MDAMVSLSVEVATSAGVELGEYRVFGDCLVPAPLGHTGTVGTPSHKVLRRTSDQATGPGFSYSIRFPEYRSTMN